IAQDAAITQRSRTVFHPPLEPTDHFALGKARRYKFCQFIKALIIGGNCSITAKDSLNLPVRKRWSEIRAVHGVGSTVEDPPIAFPNIPHCVSRPERPARVPRGRLNPDVLKH